MIEFEKWLENKECEFTCFECYSTGEFCSKLAWEAALKWVANKCRGRRSKGLCDLLDEIDRELSGK